MNIIPFDELNNTYGTITSIRNHFRDHLADSIKFADDYEAIVNYASSQIGFGSDKLSVEERCALVLGKIGYYKDGQIIEQLWDGFTDSYRPVYHYFKHVLGFNDLPKRMLAQLDALVRADLKGILRLIQRYETSEPTIIDYLADGTKRKEHEDRIRLHFYDRCVRERNTIVNYLAFGIQNRAFEKSMNEDMLGGYTTSWFNEFQDRPYRWWLPDAIRYFDYQQINTYHHRVDDVPISSLNTLKDAQASGDISKFYSELATMRPPEFIFHGIMNYLLPVNNLLDERKPIFEELEKLFEHKLWYGFTALALPQVEGIFSDMAALILPGKKFNSLPNKVLAVRPYYEYHENTFDYFEYILPRLRNRFLHSGNVIGKEFEHLAYDLLYDLGFLLQVFLRLNDEQIVLANLLNGDLERKLLSIKEFNEFFKMLGRLKARATENPGNFKLEQVLAKWADFERDRLTASGIYESIAFQITARLKDQTIELFNSIAELTKDWPEPIVIYTITSGDLRKRIPELMISLSNYRMAYTDQYQAIMDMHEWLEQYKTHLPSIKEELATELSKIYKEEKERDRIKKMGLLKPLFGNTDHHISEPL